MSAENKLLVLILDNWKLVSLVSFVPFIYYYYTKNYDYFEKRRIKYAKPIIFFGSSVSGILGTITQIKLVQDYYDYFKGVPYGGFFEGRKPIYCILDTKLIKIISISDVDHFIDRNPFESNEPRYSKRSILLLQGAEWKSVRSMLTPTFSSARIKNMFPLVLTCCDQLVDLIGLHDNDNIELKTFTGHLTLEVTGVCAFGISTDILKDNNAEYYKIAARTHYVPLPKRLFLFFIILIIPSVLKYIPISITNDESNRKLVKILQCSKAERMSGRSKRNDFLQLLIDASLKEKEEVTKNGNHLKLQLDDDTVDAQALLFLQAGFGTTSTMLTYTLLSLAVHVEVQDKLRAHILSVTKGKQLSYDQLSELDYLEAVLHETLRMNPPIPRIDRRCCKPYILPGTSIQIAVGDIMMIPVYGIHHDPEIFPDPHTFNPERFMKNGKLDKLPDSYLAFGLGPRNCIGRRFSLVVGKAVMVSLLTNFRFTTCPKTIYPLGYSKNEFLLAPEGGAWVRVEKI